MKQILVTGGTGFIGSHICLLLLERGYKVIILDSFINSSPQIGQKILEIKKINNKSGKPLLDLIKCDLRDEISLKNVFKKYTLNSLKIEAVIHLAGLKAVEESIKEPLKYWDHNVKGTINLLNIMSQFGCQKIVFSSSATIYGCQKNKYLIKENSKIEPINTYGKTKEMVEKILDSLPYLNDKSWEIAILRYFNPIGAHSSGLIGEDPLIKPNNIMPVINEVALGKRKFLEIFGNDWDTKDGTCIRDYIHVMDLAEGHIRTLEYILKSKSEIIKLNLGTGKGISVIELLETFEKVNCIKIPFKFVSRRVGDIPFSVADNSLAKQKINWNPIYGLDEMCRDSWNWFSRKSNNRLN